MGNSLSSPAASDQARMISTRYQLTNSKKELADTQATLTSGLIGPTYSSNYNVAQQSQTIKMENSALTDQNNRLNSVTSDYGTIEEAYNTFEDIMVTYNARIKNYISSGSGDPSFQDYCTSSLKRIEHLLNQKSDGGFYLFGGVGGNKPITSLENLPIPPLGQAIDPRSYSSYTSPPSLKEVNFNGFKVQFDVRYDQAEFSNMIQALTIGARTQASTDPESNDYKQLQSGMQMAVSSLNNIGSKLGKIGVSTGNIESQEESNQEKIASNFLILKEYDTEDSLITLNRFQEIINKIKVQEFASTSMSRLLSESLQAIKF